MKICSVVTRELACKNIFTSQLTKVIIGTYLDARLYRYGQYYTNATLKKSKSGLRQQSN